MKKTNVKIVVVHENEDTPCWPHINHDQKKVVDRITACITSLNPDMNFDTVYYTELEQAKADYEADVKKYDGMLVLLMTCWKYIDEFYCKNSVGSIPTIIADVPLCGTGSALVVTSSLIRENNYPIPLLSTFDYTELAQAVKNFDVIKKMKDTTILVISQTIEKERQEAISKLWGCKFVNKTAQDLGKVYEKVSEKEAKEVAERWEKDSAKVIEPSDADIVESATLHLAIKAMMKENKADAVTLDCLNLSYGNEYDNKSHMYPCLSHFEMLNNGIVAVCEADLTATVTSLIVKYMTGKSGFVSDPAIDTHSNQIIYAHCVACKKVYGFDDPRECKFFIRSHAEDQKGASVQVIFPANEQLTTLMVDSLIKTASIHSSRAVGNVGLDEGCRSKLSAEVNAENVLCNWAGVGRGWHRVTVYGEYRKLMKDLMKLKGIKVIEEDN